MRIVRISDVCEREYDDFLLNYPNTLFFVSYKYMILLQRFLDVENCTFIAIDDNNKITGVLPAFIKMNGTIGSVINSLPFYGSNGAIIGDENNIQIREKLIKKFYEYATQKKCVTTTIITSPFETNLNFYEDNTMYTFRDSRIGQLTRLPDLSKNVDQDLFDIYHYKTRNMVRKAQKSSITVTSEYNENEFEFLINTHRENLREIGGIEKPESFFRLIPETFDYGKDYNIFTAYMENIPVASLLTFYFNKTVEYFTPVIVKEYRSFQPLSLLIFEAMKDGVNKGYQWWNWGGTWATQDGVYTFKSRWGSKDKQYFYYTRIFDEQVLNLSKEVLLKEYPHFFVVPFGRLKE